MTVSIFDLFSIGIGPSSSHTVGPMRAANNFLKNISTPVEDIHSIEIELFGSLALTGKGHGTDVALILGLEGYLPEEVQPEKIPEVLSRVRQENILKIFGIKTIHFIPEEHILYSKGKRLPYHSNAMRITAKNVKRNVISKEVYYSVGGGFIVNHKEVDSKQTKPSNFPYPFTSCAELLTICKQQQWSIAEVMMQNEMTLRAGDQIKERILLIWQVMQDSVIRGCDAEGILPGGLNVKRRAKKLYQELKKKQEQQQTFPELLFDWVSLYALAVNEENAAGSKVVTAPTNGAAGVIPAVLHYLRQFTSDFSEEKVVTFFLTAGAIANLFKQGASLSAAEMGCQGEVGVASSMAAGGLAAVFGGTPRQVENAAEIAMEHHLGLTCDPVAGLVQIPCIERNTMGAIKAINAARLAMFNQEEFVVTLDQVIKSMKEIGINMHNNYKETSLGGLAAHVSVNQTEC